MAGTKCSQIQKAQRIQQIVELIASGHRDSWIRQFMATDWGMSERQAYRYLKEARAVIIEDIDKDRKDVIAEAIATCRMVIRDASKAGQYNNVIGAVNALSRLGKLDA